MHTRDPDGLVVVVGGSGTLGRLVTRRLLERGRPVRVMTRDPARAQALAAAGADVVRGDLLDRESLVRAVQGADAVVAAAHAILGRGREASAQVDGEGHKALVDVASDHGVRHVTYVSVYDHGPANRSWRFLQVKLDVERYLRSRRDGFTIIRPTAFMDFHAHQLIGVPILANRRVPLFGAGRRPRNYVAAEDVADVVIRSLDDPTLRDAVVGVAGPENLSAMDVVRCYERASGRQARVMHLPVGIARAMSALLRPVHPGVSQVLHAAVLTETTDQSCDTSGNAPDLHVGATRLEDWIGRLPSPR